MSEQDEIDAIDRLLREMNSAAGLQTPLSSEQYVGDAMWIPVSTTLPQPVPIPTPVPAAADPKKKAKKRSRSRAKSTHSRAKPVTPPSQPIQWTGISNAREDVADSFDAVIAPTISDKTEVKTRLRRHVYRRVVTEIASAQMRERAKLVVITPDEVLEAISAACEQVGINLNV